MQVSTLARAAGSIGNLLEVTLTSEAAAVGQSLATIGPAAVDAAISTGLATIEGSAVTAAGVGALSNPLTWAGVAAFAAGVGVAGGAYCLTQGCDLSQLMSSPVSSLMNLLPVYQLSQGSSLYQATVVASPPYTLVGADPVAVGQKALRTSATQQGGITDCKVTSSTKAGAGLQDGTGAYGTCHNSIFNNEQQWNSGKAPSNTFNIPSGGLSNLIGNIFHVPNSNPQTLTAAEAIPQTPVYENPFGQKASEFTPKQQAEPVDPALIANIAEKLRQAIADGGGPMAPMAQAMPPVSAGMVQTSEAQSGIFPSLGDLFNPVQSGAMVTTGAGGAPVPSATTSVALATNNPGTTAVDATTQKNAAPCGNILAGQAPCATTLDFTFNPRTGSWEFDDGEPGLANQDQKKGLARVPNTSDLQQTQKEVKTQTQTLTDGQTSTGTLTTTDVLTDPKVAVDTLTQTQTATETARRTPITQPTGMPPMTLPFNEWPQVMQDFNTKVPQLSTVTCPTVSFRSAILHNTKFTLSAHCLVMEAMKPWMAYVLPPTYLFMGLLLLMGS
jgi:hypothetical protein